MNFTVLRLRQVFVYQFRFIAYAFSFIIPLLFSSPQIITGAIINCLLFLSVQKLTKKEIIPLIILPSLGAMAHGVLFGPQTVFLFYFLPLIWIGNYVLVSTYSYLLKQPYFVKIIISALAKFLILQLFAQIYFRSGIVPSLFVTSMGYIQLITAVLGGYLAYGITKITDYER